MAEKSCAILVNTRNKNRPKYVRVCYTPLEGPCPDCTATPADNQHRNRDNNQKDNQESSPLKAISKSGPLTQCFKDPPPPEKCCNLRDAENATHINNFCTTKCTWPPTGVNMHLEEWTRRPRPKPTYKHSVYLNNELLVGRAFPVKFRIRRKIEKCSDCGKNVYLRDAVADNTSVVVLDNCCDVKVYSSKAMDNWHRVPLMTIAGNTVRKKKTLNEICVLEPKKIPPPVIQEPPPVVKSAPNAKAKGKGKKK